MVVFCVWMCKYTVCSASGKFFCKSILKSTELWVIVYAAASIPSGLLEFILDSCEDPCCKVSASVRQNTSGAYGDTLFGMLAWAFI